MKQTLPSTANTTKIKLKKKKKTKTVMLVRSRVLTIIRRATILVPILNFQKTSVSVNNFRASD